jgi:hypothetical protein
MLCAALGLALPARAQFDIERFEPALDEEGFLGVQGSRTPGPERASYALFAHYATSLLLVEAPGGDALAVVERRAAGVLSAEAGLGTRVALGLSLPFVLDQRGDKLVTAGPKLPVTLLADPRVHLRYRFVGDASESRTEQRDGPGVALQLSHALPVGDDDGYVGEETLRSELQLIGDMHLLGAGIGASVGIRHRFERARIFNVTLRDELTFGVGLRVPVPPLYPLAGLIELRGATDFESAETTSLEGEVGAVLPLGDFSFVLSGGAGMSGGIGTPAARVILGLWFTPGDPDSDGDGVPNDVDQCPPLPEDRDGFQDDDGCPDPDNDNDLVPDVDDLCPNVEAIEGRDDDEDGCTDKS